VNFDFDKSEIRPDAAVALNEAVSLAGDLLEQCSAKRISIEGHTDSTGPDAYNQGLSERRAASVRQYLIDKGLDGSRLTATGFGESQPVGSNETREGRALNRRVDLRMVE
jgi:OOP family OmpA-OmpF porin